MQIIVKKSNFKHNLFKIVLAPTQKCSTAPNDITPIGAEFNFNDQIERLKNFTFPKSGTVKNQRSFQLQWLQRYKWIEYSISRDAVFCNICRQFGKNIQDCKFVTTGYSAWKTALSKDKGFERHNNSAEHLHAISIQIEQRKRIESGTSVSELVNTSVLEKRRYYCKSIIEVIMFLVGNRLALRGDWDDEEKEEGGLFNSLFEFAMKKDTRLVECQTAMPPNITYKSPQIQNEFISILAHEVRANIVKEVKEADCDAYTILFDGTKDKNGNECVSIAVRFISKGKPIEVLLFFETTENVDAATFTKLMIDSLIKYGLDPKKIICQCYDGAAVMNGYKSGVAKRLQDLLNKKIPYVHCFNHRLRLVIIDTVKRIQLIKEFFEQIQLIYTSFKKPKIKKLYDGSAIKRLIDTRWTGHFQATKAVYQNYSEIVNTLKRVSEDEQNALKLDGDDIAICMGILSVITQKKFVFSLVFMDAFLSTLEPADSIFQMREMSYRRAMPVIDAVKSTINEYRTETKFESFMANALQLIPESLQIAQPIRRTRRRPTAMDDFTVEETIGERSNEFDEIKSCFFEVIDVALAEFGARFTENNDILLALSSEMELSQLKPLEQLGICLPQEHELITAQKYVKGKYEDWKKEKTDTRFNTLSILYEVRDAFPKVYETYAFIETFGCSTAVCESSFSALAQINIPSRLSMTNERMRNLAFLAFEHKRLQNISIDEVMRKFNDAKQRRVQLY